MKSPDKFEDYVKRSIVKKQHPDISRAKFLIDTSDLFKLDLDNRNRNEGATDINANALIKESYDLIMEITKPSGSLRFCENRKNLHFRLHNKLWRFLRVLIRAKMLISGYSSSGEGAHEAEVSFIEKLDFSESDVNFLNQIRYTRNGIDYYGKIFKKEDAEAVLRFLYRIYSILRSKVEN